MSDRFDDLARALAQPIGRRRMLGLTGATLGSVSLGALWPGRARASHPCDYSGSPCGTAHFDPSRPDAVGNVWCCGGQVHTHCCKASEGPFPGDAFCCPTGKRCGKTVGECLEPCPPGTTECGTTCCPGGQTCENNQCVGCPTGEEKCGDACCPEGQFCCSASQGLCCPADGLCCNPGTAEATCTSPSVCTPLKQ